jgi:hypothetical protein
MIQLKTETLWQTERAISFIPVDLGHDQGHLTTADIVIGSWSCDIGLQRCKTLQMFQDVLDFL